MEIHRFMRHHNQLVSCTSNDTFRVAISNMAKHTVGSVLVKNAEEITGIVTTRDIITALDKYGEKAFDITLDTIMSDNLITVNIEDPLNVAIETMDKAGTHHLLVEDKNTIVGLISSSDIIREKALDYKAHPWIRR